MNNAFPRLRKSKSKKANSTLEVVVFYTAVIGVAFTFLRPGGAFQRVFHRVVSSGVYQAEQMSLKISKPGEQSSITGSMFREWYQGQGGYEKAFSMMRAGTIQAQGGSFSRIGR